MKVLIALGALCALLLATACPGFAAAADADGADAVSVGGGLIDFGRERIYHATTRCRQVGYLGCGHVARGEQADRVEVNRESPASFQLLLTYQPFRRPDRGGSPDATAGIFATLVTSFGIDAENKKIIDGVGLGYNLAAFDLFGRKDAVSIGLGGVWLDDLHVLRRGVRPGGIEPARVASPTRRTSMAAPMFTIAAGL